MRPLALLLLAGGAVGVGATFVLALGGDTDTALQVSGAACSALVLGAILYRR